MRTKLKLGLATVAILSFGAVSAQQLTGDVAQNIVNGVNTPGSVTPTVRVIDNKGTIKYLQSKNGITMITNTTANVTTTTWQLGGTLTDDTYIDATGKIYAIKGVKAVNDAAFTPAEQLAATAYDATGFTILTRDEVTGETKKMLASDLIVAGRAEFPIATAGQTAVTATGLAAGTSINKISVYRNGAKLRAGVDYTLTAADTITLDLSAAAPNDWTTYVGDIIEVQWIY
ncbi:hypothetical protein FFWV33_09475 [Flavobacterium faecale]|uniref:Uncharacterized protein n=1 Tax=Flavobacterium faecale TaxID=1355330 RepID=A0A2S1LDE4_9FLAO|nr:hypothetical protein [Flavobacterium faecale]AWG21754.1 hypothetical protein FFWV33_09475 [Flavobacterium faecale]